VAPPLEPTEIEGPGGVTSTPTDGSDTDGAEVAGGVVGVVVGGVVVGGVVVGGAEVDVGADGLDAGADVEVPGEVVDDDDGASVAPAAVVGAPGFGWVAAPRGPAEVVGVDDVAVVPASDARTPATVDVGPTTGTFPATDGWTAGPETPAGAGFPAPGAAVLPAAWDVESGVESCARAAGGATHGRRSPGRTGPPRRPTARTAT
jgi:hypothetical protein